MGKRLDKIKEVNAILTALSDATGRLCELAKTLKVSTLKKLLLGFVRMYAKLNYDFSTSMMEETFSGYRADKDEQEFNGIIKPLKDEIERKDNE